MTQAHPEVQLEVETAVAPLGVEERERIVLKFYNGLTFKEIGALMDVSVNTAASWYRRGLEKMKARSRSRVAVRGVLCLLFAVCGFVFHFALPEAKHGAADLLPTKICIIEPGTELPARFPDFSPEPEPLRPWPDNMPVHVSVGPEPGTSENGSET
ncbi:MAG TPA: sigma-70 family RNA polymerase sigma factor [Candidatus Hydrogenedentes bacterium]|nr:sigma-70 family RNA polymerase sigma factor [Candidatus Hydrogenedentota bacterium]